MNDRSVGNLTKLMENKGSFREQTKLTILND